jgi:hypothetical protein
MSHKHLSQLLTDALAIEAKEAGESKAILKIPSLFNFLSFEFL